MGNYSGSSLRNHIIEQAHLGRKIRVHRPVVIEMVAAQIGESPGRNARPFVAELVQSVARCLVGDMGHPFTAQSAQIREKCDDVRRRQPGGNRSVRGSYTQRPNRCRTVPPHMPELARNHGIAVRYCAIPA